MGTSRRAWGWEKGLRALVLRAPKAQKKSSLPQAPCMPTTGKTNSSICCHVDSRYMLYALSFSKVCEHCSSSRSSLFHSSGCFRKEAESRASRRGLHFPSDSSDLNRISTTTSFIQVSRPSRDPSLAAPGNSSSNLASDSVSSMGTRRRTSPAPASRLATRHSWPSASPTEQPWNSCTLKAACQPASLSSRRLERGALLPNLVAKGRLLLGAQLGIPPRGSHRPTVADLTPPRGSPPRAQSLLWPVARPLLRATSAIAGA
mmetsp:Transcript_3305/g.11627  ORF Transcript_3305/g.11627 Transcript_3305/m.11627 type:complete len:260 (+) Transcript_3305:1804-2583(+)